MALLSLAAVGMLVFGFTAHTALRSYLADRVDQQVQAATFPVLGALAGKAASRGGPGDLPGDFRLPDRGGEPQRIETVQLPPGTYGELRSRKGKVISRTTFSYGEENLPKPDIPEDLAGGDADAPETVGSTNGSTQFRVTTVPLPENRGTILVAVPLTDLEQTLDRLAAIELVTGAAVLALLAAFAWWVIRLGLRPLEQMETTAGLIASGELSRRVEPAGERTEVGRLGMALNQMLRQIETAFDERRASEERLRHFLADASHELRTPLSSIRGYSELFRLGATADPEELEQAMARIEDESERMGNIVDDLLTLARLDQAPKLRRQPTDLAGLAEDACRDARVAAPGYLISCEESADPRLCVIDGDPDQLRQVFANLLANATRHNPRRTPVTVTVSGDAEGATVLVRDRGPGLEPGSEELVFDRFWRPAGARPRDRGGSGLGLAIVEGIVSAHGGSVTAANAPGGGAEFTVWLPRHGAELTKSSEDSLTINSASGY
ncbi:MAG: sensor histidine kinase [Solirubrobacterales bacterium]